MVAAESDAIPHKFIVESFYNHDSPAERRPLRRFEFDTSDQALECARRIIDKSLRRTRNSSRTPVEWYRHWLACGDSAVTFGTAFDPRGYAKMRIKIISRHDNDRGAPAGGAKMHKPSHTHSTAAHR